jgi:hypothetical protein
VRPEVIRQANKLARAIPDGCETVQVACYMDDGNTVLDIYEMTPSAFVTKAKRATMKMKRIVDRYRTVDMLAFFPDSEVVSKIVISGGVVWFNDAPVYEP